MNIKEAKQIRLVEYLRIIGHSPVNTRGCQYWYLSPLREERCLLYTSGLLDPIERAKSIERVENGSACLLYISPESLRSKTIERLLLGRGITRFVIDEAHCFSVWGKDFRPDYMYIADFIKLIQEKAVYTRQRKR